MTEHSAQNGSIEERILQAALELFVEKGYHDTSIPEIVKRSGTSTGAVYHHFQSKRQIADSLHTRVTDRFRTIHEEKTFSAEGALEQIHAYIQTMFEMTENEPYLVSYLNFTSQPVDEGEALHVCSREGLKVINVIMEHGKEEGVIRDMDNHVLSGIMCGITARFIGMRLDRIITDPLPEHADDVAAAVIRSIAKREATPAADE